jgi:DNA-binding Lrp family transcriptional regulator
MATAHVLINCDIGFEGSIIEKLKKIEDVKEIRGILGAYDIIVKLECLTNERLREIVTWKIRKIQQVRSTITLLDIWELH